MATITSYESLHHPSKSDLKQFSELLEPLFLSSSDEARREAAAVLSQCTVLPPSVALFIGLQPINVAAIFLTRSTAIDDATLMTIAKSQGAAHARAIASRENLSPTVVDMLVGLRYSESLVAHHHPVKKSKPVQAKASPMQQKPANPIILDHVPAKPTADSVREELRALVTRQAAKDPEQTGMPVITDLHEALFIRFARERQGAAFARVLKTALQASLSLAERIMLDLSGTQLATTLLALGLRFEEISLVLRSFYPQLNEMENHHLRSVALLASLDVSECRERVGAWLRADLYTQDPTSTEPVHEPLLAANRPADPREPREHKITYAPGAITGVQVKSRRIQRAG